MICKTQEEFMEAMKKAKPGDTIFWDESDGTSYKSQLMREAEAAYEASIRKQGKH